MIQFYFLVFSEIRTYDFQISRESDISKTLVVAGIYRTHLGTHSIENSSISIFSRLSSRKIRRDITRSTEPRSAASHENRKLRTRYIE